MSDLPRYWTREFVVGHFVEELREDPAFLKAIAKLDTTIQVRCFGMPDGTDGCGTYRVRRGTVEVDLRIEDAPSALRDEPLDKSFLARTTAPYELWCKLDRGEMSVLAALTSPDYQVEGPKLKIMRNIGVFNAMNAVSARIPKTY